MADEVRANLAREVRGESSGMSPEREYLYGLLAEWSSGSWLVAPEAELARVRQIAQRLPFWHTEEAAFDCATEAMRRAVEDDAYDAMVAWAGENVGSKSEVVREAAVRVRAYLAGWKRAGDERRYYLRVAAGMIPPPGDMSWAVVKKTRPVVLAVMAVGALMSWEWWRVIRNWLRGETE